MLIRTKYAGRRINDSTARGYKVGLDRPRRHADAPATRPLSAPGTFRRWSRSHINHPLHFIRGSPYKIVITEWREKLSMSLALGIGACEVAVAVGFVLATTLYITFIRGYPYKIRRAARE